MDACGCKEKAEMALKPTGGRQVRIDRNAHEQRAVNTLPTGLVMYSSSPGPMTQQPVTVESQPFSFILGSVLLKPALLGFTRILHWRLVGDR